MKHGSTTRHLKQKDRQLSGQQLVKAVQSEQKLYSGLARLWHPYFRTRMVFCLSTILRKKEPSIANIILLNYLLLLLILYYILYSCSPDFLTGLRG